MFLYMYVLGLLSVFLRGQGLAFVSEDKLATLVGNLPHVTVERRYLGR